MATTRRADAERNRRALLTAARQVFERDGYVAARVTDIADAAGLAHGSFYSHFQGKDDVLAAVLAEIEDEMLTGPELTGPDPAATIGAVNRAYLEAYQRNAALMGVLEQVATVDPRFGELRLQRSQAFLTRNARAIRRLQAAGLADTSLDPDVTALALSNMVSRTAYAVFVLGLSSGGIGELADTLTRLWVSALGIPHSRQGT
jgi:AcrR family transcriptional regulator